MKNLTRTSGILIPKSDPRIDDIKHRLTKRVFDFNGESKWVEFYENLDNHILVPRYFINDDNIIDQTIDGEDIQIESKIVPRSSAQKNAIELLSTQLNGVLKLETGRGKAQPLMSKILTPYGWEYLRDIKPGDVISCPVTGKTTKVLNVFNQGSKPIYTITFSDGSKTECCNEHLWNVKVNNKGEWQTKCLRDISKLHHKNNKIYIPISAPIEFENNLELYKDCYFVGTTLNSNKSNATAPSRGLFIPIEKRVEILQGIMDSYGDVDVDKNMLTLRTQSEYYKKYIVSLVQTLGGVVYIDIEHKIEPDTQEYKTFYTLNIILNENIIPFRNNVKLEKYNSINKCKPFKFITDITFKANFLCACIEVDSPHHLYITDNCIVTHNTVTAIASICNIKKKTIIFVHKDSLIKNWTSEFVLHTSLNENDIGKLSTKNYKECLKKPIILCTPHVISIILKKDDITKMEFLDALQSAGIGMQIVDECHVGVGPEQFSKASLMINSRRNWGLSATPNRNDDCNDIIRYHLGEIEYIPPDDNETMDPIIYAVKFDHEVYSKHKRYIQYGGKFNTIKYTNMFKKSDIYKNNLKSLILDAYSKNRNILILGTTILPILELAEHCNIPKSDVGIFMAGAVSNKKYKPLLEKISDTTDLYTAFHEKRVVFSTYQMARDGNNRKNLDCLFMLTTTNNCEQAIGRILRQDKNKKQPIVIDIVDTDGPLDKSKIPLFERYFQKRMELYKSKNWETKIFNIKQGKLYGNQN